MTILDNNDQDLMQLWAMITELSDQLNQNRNLSVSLYGQAGNIKNQAVHSQTGFVLRRFNMHLSKEVYDAELERMNTSMTTENQGLQHDNKQLNTLIKEYEQTLETLMSNFRNRAQDVQERELSLIREYETKLLAREEENATQELSTSTALSESFARLSHLLRLILRSQAGEDVEPPTEPRNIDEDEDREPWATIDPSDYSMEREIELARLEKENEELRRMIGLLPPHQRREMHHSEQRHAFEPPRPQVQRTMSGQGRLGGGGVAGSGPSGTFKRLRAPG